MIKVSFILNEVGGSVLPHFTLEDGDATDLEKRVLASQKDMFKSGICLFDDLVQRAVEKYRKESESKPENTKS